MVLPAIIGAGLKIFQATRGKASSGSDVASNIVSKKTTVSGSSVGRPKSGAIIKASSNKISGAKFLQSTTALFFSYDTENESQLFLINFSYGWL